MKFPVRLKAMTGQLPADFFTLTLTDCTAPNGPNNCHKTFSSVSGAKLYTKIHHPEPLIVFVDSIELAKMSLVNGEYLEEVKLDKSINVIANS